VMPQLTNAPSVDVGVLIRRPPHDVFEALADPSITTRFWYTKSTGRMAEGAQLTWEWEMYGASGKVWVEEVQADRRIRFSWEGYDPSHPTTVEFQFIPYENDTPTCASPRPGSPETPTPRSAGHSNPPPASPSCSAR
jgi:uncharacterized protein YndB with AHSA1/START domain